MALDRPGYRLFRRAAGEQDRFVGGLERGPAPAGEPARLRHAGSVEPHQCVAQLQAGVLQAGCEAVRSARRTERQQLTARLEYAQDLLAPGAAPGLVCLAEVEPRMSCAGGRRSDVLAVPALVVEADPVGRVGHHRIDRSRVDVGEQVEAVAVLDPPGRACGGRGRGAASVALCPMAEIRQV
jgi:hypothetical protein